jgi:hypothetical protein
VGRGPVVPSPFRFPSRIPIFRAVLHRSGKGGERGLRVDDDAAQQPGGGHARGAGAEAQAGEGARAEPGLVDAQAVDHGHRHLERRAAPAVHVRVVLGDLAGARRRRIRVTQAQAPQWQATVVQWVGWLSVGEGGWVVGGCAVMRRGWRGAWPCGERRGTW